MVDTAVAGLPERQREAVIMRLYTGLTFAQAAEVIGQQLGWSASQRFDAVREFVRGAWVGRAPVLGRSGWAQEELAQGALRGLR